MFRTGLSLVFLSLASLPLSAQSAILELPGKRVEVVGLQRWTVQMIEDSLAKYAPGTSLTSHSCAGKLRYNVGFADAVNWTIRSPRDSAVNVVVVVVEPQDSARVKYRRLPLVNGGPLRSGWKDAVDILENQTAAFYEAASAYLDPSRSATTIQRDSAAVVRLWAFLDAHRSKEDAALAREVLLRDPSMHNRSVAALMLLNFSQDDRTWWALVEAMRESDGLAKGTASIVLGEFVEHVPRQVDWRPATDAIHAMLDGTSVSRLPELMRVLIATGVSKESAPAFVGQGGRMLVSFAGAQHPMLHLPARRLLQVLSGKDYGSDVERWRNWINSLPASKRSA